jgi:hypothetical protein
MKSLYVFCEGRTERGFVASVLAPHLYGFGFLHIPPVLVAHSRHHGMVARGGIRSYAPLKRDIEATLKSRRQTDVYFTTMIDLFRLPQDFPGKSGLVRNPSNPMPYVQALEAAFASDIADCRFVPYLQLHEYETLLYADPDAFQISFTDCAKAIEDLKAIAASVTSIELINDGDQTAPSKRIINVLPEYDQRKADAGPEIAEYIGLPTLRQKCPHFDAWITKLENL